MNIYYETIHRIERLHREFLELLKVELNRLSIESINNVQALLLYNMGSESLTPGELTQRGYYLGSNVSYNLKRLIEHGFVIRAPSPHDRRLARLTLSPDGIALCTELDTVFKRHSTHLARNGLGNGEMQRLGQALGKLEQFLLRQALPEVRTADRA